MKFSVSSVCLILGIGWSLAGAVPATVVETDLELAKEQEAGIIQVSSPTDGATVLKARKDEERKQKLLQELRKLYPSLHPEMK